MESGKKKLKLWARDEFIFELLSNKVKLEGPERGLSLKTGTLVISKLALLCLAPSGSFLGGISHMIQMNQEIALAKWTLVLLW